MRSQQESRMREIRTYGLRRGAKNGQRPTWPLLYWSILRRACRGRVSSWNQPMATKGYLFTRSFAGVTSNQLENRNISGRALRVSLRRLQ